jgi:SAM-dependent methyltransferase
MYTFSFICPRALSASYQTNQPVEEHLLAKSTSGDVWEGPTVAYQVTNGVPILYPIADDPSDRNAFYEAHYTGRSREADLQSDYLARERHALRDFVGSRQLEGPTLEIGCGTGICADLVPQYLGLDFSLEALFAEGFEGYSRIAASAEAIPLKKETIQLVISFNVLEHVPRPDLAFLEMDRVLQPGGYVFLRPAWNTSTIQTKLLTERPYADLPWFDKVHKFLVPLLRSKAYKAADRLPRRMFWLFYHGWRRRISPVALRYRHIDPWFGESAVHVADSDACSQIDVFAAIQFFSSRGYKILSHNTVLTQVFAGHDVLIARKPQ